MNAMDYADILREIEALAERGRPANEFMESIASLLAHRAPHYDWVGFYLLNQDGKTLELGPYRGAATPHTRIPLDKGICGTAVSSGKTIVVDDVNRDPRYLACSVETKSEIVVPIYRNGRVIGELDIDSHTAAAFTKHDRELIESCARVLTKILEAEAA